MAQASSRSHASRSGLSPKPQKLAGELEVSERTIYRDIDALSTAGVPLYSESGPQGGFALVDSYRSTLTGLTEGEVRALSMLGVPAPLADLGVSDELRRALRKMAAAVPDRRWVERGRVNIAWVCSESCR